MEAKRCRKVRTESIGCRMEDLYRPTLISIMVKQKLQRPSEKLTIGFLAIIVGENLTKKLPKDTFLIAEKRARIFEEALDEGDCKRKTIKAPPNKRFLIIT